MITYVIVMSKHKPYFKTTFRKKLTDMRLRAADKLLAFSERLNQKSKSKLYMHQNISGRDLIAAIDEAESDPLVEPVRVFKTLPDEYRVEDSDALEATIINKINNGNMLSLPNDVTLKNLGFLVQLYASLDLQFYRWRQLFVETGYLPRRALKSNDRAKLMAQIHDGLEKLSLHHAEKKMSEVGLKRIEDYMGFRDIACHFILKVDQQEKALIFLSTRDRDSKELTGSFGDTQHATYCILRIHHFLQLISEVNELQHWADQTTREWTQRLK